VVIVSASTSRVLLEATDILSTAAIALVVLVVAVVASVLPARAGSRVEPLTALRAE
jgi:ABC-type lipoprotein release transport system permease subunit